jgi:tetratricopeptide (TPR) repeat protein
MSRKRNQITIRLRQSFSWLGLIGLLLLGMLAAGNVYGRGVWLFAAVFAAMVVGIVCDGLVLNGERLKRRGPKAMLYALVLGQKRKLAIAEIETISSFVVGRRRNGAFIHRTVITGAGLRWELSSRQPAYHCFIKSLFRLVSPNKLDPSSSLLLEHWLARDPLSLWGFASHQPALLTPPRLWRTLANQFTLQGQFEVASRYFQLAYRQDPHNAHLLYEMGRFLYLRASFEKQWAGSSGQWAESNKRRAQSGKQLITAPSPLPPAHYLRRAEACLRLAGRLAKDDAALLERIGETFFEFHLNRQASLYFERALKVDTARARANIGLAEVALRSGKVVRVVHYYRAAARAAAEQGDASLAALAERRADYNERLRGDDRFIDAEMARLNLLDHLKWARRGALVAFLVAWFIHLTCPQFAPWMQALSREISATAAIIWISTLTASYFFSQRRN